MALPAWFYNDPDTEKEERKVKRVKKDKSPKKFPFKTVVVILLLANLGFGIYFWLWTDNQFTEKINLIADQTNKNQKTLDSVSKKVNGLPSASDIVSELDRSPYSPFN